MLRRPKLSFAGITIENDAVLPWRMLQAKAASLLTVSGSDGPDFIHAAGDGHSSPPGYNKITYSPSSDSTVTIYGGNGSDVIYGGAGISYDFIGGVGQDRLIGESRKDRFEFTAFSDSPAGKAFRDIVSGFGTGDTIRFTGALASEALHFGLSSFTGSADEIIQYVRGSYTILAVDRDGDAVADFEVAIKGEPQLQNANLEIGATTSIAGTQQDDIIHSINEAVPVPDGYNNESYIDPTIARAGIAGAELQGGGGNDIIYGTTSSFAYDNDIIEGGAGTDRIYGESGDDTILVSLATDINGLFEVIDGGDGNDTLLFLGGGTFDLSKATITSIDTIAFSDLSTLIVDPNHIGAIEDVTIAAGAEQSTIELAEAGSFALARADWINIVGSDGADNFRVESDGGLSLDGGNGDDTMFLPYVEDSSVAGGDGSDHISIEIYSNVMVEGGAGDDTVFLLMRSFEGTPGAHIFGDEGNDSLTAGTGEDRVDGGVGNDNLSGRGGDDVLIGGPGVDILTGGPGSDHFVIDQLGAEIDTITDFASGHADRLDLSRLDGDTTTPSIQGFHFGGAAFTGSVGELIQYSTGSNSTMLAGDVDGDGIADFQVAFSGGKMLIASDLIDSIAGMDGNDAIVGGQANDIIDGLGGDDLLTGGQGQDVTTGGLGADTFVFRTTVGTAPGQYSRDTITDFSRAESDRIDLSNIDADTTTAGNQSFHLGGSAFTATPGELIQTVTDGHTILSGDVNGDAVADFQIDLSNGFTLVSADFVL